MPIIPDFTDEEIFGIRELLTLQYGKDVGIELAECELVLDNSSDGSVACPTVFWHEQGANFVVFKTGLCAFRSQFFYTPHEQYGSGMEEYDHLDKCVEAILLAQADHEREAVIHETGSEKSCQ